MRKQLESMLRAGQAELVLQAADEYFKRCGPDDADAQWIALRAVQAAGIVNAWGQAVSWADRAWTIKPADDKVGGWLHFYKGTALIHIGDMYGAEAELQRFLALAPQTTPLRWFAGDALFNLGHVRRVLGDADHGASYFAEAARAYESAGRLGQVPGCTYEIGWGLLLAGDIVAAQPHVEGASRMLEQSDEPDLIAKLDIAWALHDRLIGAWQRSSLTCDTVLARHDLLPEQVADCCWILGRNAVTAGDLVGATLHAERAYDAALRYWWPPQLDRIDQLKAEIARVTSA